MKVQELENAMKIKEEQIINNKYKLESTTDYIHQNTKDKKNLDQKLENHIQKVQQMEGKMGELRSSKALLEIQLKEMANEHKIIKEESQGLEKKLFKQITKNTEYQVVINDLENKVRRLQERLD